MIKFFAYLKIFYKNIFKQIKSFLIRLVRNYFLCKKDKILVLKKFYKSLILFINKVSLYVCYYILKDHTSFFAAKSLAVPVFVRTLSFRKVDKMLIICCLLMFHAMLQVYFLSICSNRFASVF